MTFPRSERFLDLLLIIDIDHDSAEMAGFSLVVLCGALPWARNHWPGLRLAVYPVLHVEAATGLDGSRHGLLGALAFFRVKKGKEHLVGKRQVVGYAEKCPGRIRPKQPVRRKIQIPHSNAGSFDTQPKALISNGIIGRWMYDGGHVSP